MAGQVGLLIKYFTVPKKIINGVVQDWRIVFHAGANKLNDCVWMPLFSLPTLNEDTLMADRDMGEMFLNFDLHHNTVCFACIDVGPLGFTKEDYQHRWMCWTCNLMAFKASPYNSVRMYLVAEEVIWRDRHNSTNTFQWTHLRLNLPGTKSYTPLQGWISKRQMDGSLASKSVCFVDDQRVTAPSSKQIIEARHVISTRESYLGLQDALRKVRASHGLQCPGAWARSNVCVKPSLV